MSKRNNAADITRESNGRFNAGLERACVCGHRNGQHVAGGHECLEDCECEKFKKAKVQP